MELEKIAAPLQKRYKYRLREFLDGHPSGYKKAFAEKIGVGYSSLLLWSSIPYGSDKGITYQNLEKLAGALGVTIDDLYTPEKEEADL